MVEKYLKTGLLEPCISPCNTPIMAVPKPKKNKDDPTIYRFIRNLRAVINVVEPMQAIVANPYTILNGVMPKAEYFTVVGLKDALFSVPVNESSRDLFAFEWTDPETKRTHKYRWTVLPQGFVHSPTIFAQVLGTHLVQINLEEGSCILQYVDDILITSTNEGLCKRATWSLLNYLG